MRKKIISWCLIFVILFGMSSQLFITSEAIGSVSGECGDDLEWLLDLKTGILTISGQGKMWDWASVMSSLYADPVSTAPWNSYSNEIKQVIIPEGVTTIGDCAFLNCTNLSYINIPEGVTSIGMSAFESCCNLNEIIIPSTVTYISSGTFKCTALKEIVLPKKLTFLGAVAFYGCSDLRNVYFLGDAPNLGYNAFGECPEGLTIFYVHGKSGWSGTKWKNYSLATWEGDGEDNQTTEPTEKPTQKPTEAPTQQPTEEQRPTSPAIDMQSGSCGSKAKWSADGQKRVLTISGSGKMEDYSVVTLPTWYMYNYDLGEGKGIATIVIQEGIVSVGGCAFYGLSDVTSVSFPSTLKEIGPAAFIYCTNLAAVSLPESLENIGSNAFEYCSSLEEVTIPQSVKEINSTAFGRCDKLKKITILNPNCKISDYKDTLNDPSTTVICGYANSTAQEYAEKYGYQFKAVAVPETDSQGELTAENVEDVIKIYVRDMDTWAYRPEFMPDGYRYGFWDLDGDGILELFLSITDGSGMISENHFYKIDLDSKKVIEVLVEENENLIHSDPELNTSVVIYQSKDTGKIYYLCQNSDRVGAGCGYKEMYFLTYNGNEIKHIPLWGQTFTPEGDSYQICTNNQWIDTSESTWLQHQDGTLSDYSKVSGEITTVDGRLIDKGQEQDVIRMLSELYNSFKSTVKFGANEDGADTNYEMDQVPTTNEFNTYFVDNYYSNILQMSLYESAASGIVECSTNFQINWNTYLSGLSDKKFVDLSKVSVNPHYYYEIALLEAIMQTKLNDDYLSSLTSQVGSLTIDALSFYVKYDANFNNYEDILKTKLKDSMPYFRTDSSEFLRIKDYYGQYCRQLDNYEVVKDIYDMTTEIDGSVEDFFNALSSYAGVRQASNEILSALKYLRSDLEKSSVEEDRLILKAVNNLILAFESDLDRQLVINTLKTTQDQLWNVFYSAMGIAFADLDLTLTVADFSIDTALTLSNVIFPTTISSTSYCKIYADFSIETVVQRAMLGAYDEYLISPSQGLADSIIGLYDLLGYTYSHEIEVASVLSEQLHKDGLINGLKNVFSGRNAEVYEYEQECIRAYNAYLKDIQKVKVEALEAYGLAVGRLQPVVTVYFVNGKVVAVNEVSIETGTLYDVSSGGFKLPEFTNLYVEIGGYYTNEAMTILYNESEVVNGPITLYCDLLVLKQSDGTPVLFDHSTGISVTRNEEGNHTVLNTSKITDGEHYESVKEYFRGKEIDLYDISLVQGGRTIQPQGEVVVEIPVDGEHTYKKLRVYRIEADGTYTDMDATYDNQTCRFTTAHFSSYVVVYENAVSIWGIVLIVVIAVCCATVIGVYFVKRKKK